MSLPFSIMQLFALMDSKEKKIMLEKINSWLPQIFDKIKTGLNNVPKPVKWIGIAYGLFVCFILLLYVGIYIYEFSNGKSRSADLLPFINILVGGAFISFITFLLGLCIDSNDNGIPDTLEKEGKNSEK